VYEIDVNVAAMNDEERRQHEVDKLIHNKIAKEFCMKARMKAKMRKLHKQESLKGLVAGNGLGAMLNLKVDIPSVDAPPGPLTLQRSLSESSSVSRISAPLLSSRSVNSSLSYEDNIDSIMDASKMSESIPLKRTLSDVLRDVTNQSKDEASGKAVKVQRSSCFTSENSRNGLNQFVAPKPSVPLQTNASTTSSVAVKSSLYHGTINKAELDAGYGMGMAITKNRKVAANPTGSLFSKVVATAPSGTSTTTASNIPSRTFSFGSALGATSASDGRKLKRIRPSSSFVTVSSKQFIFSESLHGGSGVNSMNGFDESSNINYSTMPSSNGERSSDSRSNNESISLFAKVSSANTGASASLKRSVSSAR
jgi:hypothetical protein